MIKIEHISKSYSPKQPLAVDDLTLDALDGEILGLVGLNGAGKTTTIRIACGIILPTHGSVKIDEYDIVTQKLEASRRIGWVPEFPNFEPNARALPLMKYFAGFYGITGAEADTMIRESLESVGLTGYMNRKLSGYSQGMKKRFSIAESLIGNPQNVLFDETFNGLDPEGVIFVRNLITGLRSKGKAIILSSHILTEVQNIADRVAIISHGKLVKILTKSEMKNLGKETMYISIDNPDDDLAKALKKFGEPALTGNDVVLKDIKIPRDQYPDISRELISNGYRLRSIQIAGESLEEYFISLVGDRI